MLGTRWFFIVCLFVSFVGVGVIAGVPLAGHNQPASHDIAAGHEVWRTYGCEGCHTLYGQGGAYAPDLTHIVNQRGPDYLREFMVNPNAFHPGQRAMPRFNITQDEVTHLLAFLQYQARTQHWPPRPIVVAGGQPIFGPLADDANTGGDPQRASGRLVFSQRCASCHSLEPGVNQVGPTLWNIASVAISRVPGQTAEQYIRDSILYPGDYIVEGYADVMQKNLGEVLSSEDIDAVVAFLLALGQNDS